jgi:hypothetical protein
MGGSLLLICLAQNDAAGGTGDFDRPLTLYAPLPWMGGNFSAVAGMALLPPFRKPGLIERGGDIVLGATEWVFQRGISFARAKSPQEYDPRSPTRPFFDRFISPLERPVQERGTAAIFGSLLMERETEFLRRFQGTYLYTLNVSLGYQDVSLADVSREQLKIALESLERTLLRRQTGADVARRVQTEGMAVWNWAALDAVVLPPAILGITYYRGVDWSVRDMGEKLLRISVEPPYVLVDDPDEDRPALVGVDLWTPVPFLRILLWAGREEGEWGITFVGLGTDLEIGRKAIFEHRPEE